jgi:hypothetical protein
MPIRVVPLSSGFMLTSIVGAIVSGIYVYPANPSWGFTLLLFFTIMLVASFISMTYAPLEAKDALQVRKK